MILAFAAAVFFLVITPGPAVLSVAGATLRRLDLRSRTQRIVNIDMALSMLIAIGLALAKAKYVLRQL